LTCGAVGAVAVAQTPDPSVPLPAVAREVIAQASGTERAVIEAFARGVNAGLRLVRAAVEYFVLGQSPAPWRAIHQSGRARHVVGLQAVTCDARCCDRDQCAASQVQSAAAGWKCGLGFLYPAGTGWDAPVAQAAVPVAANCSARAEVLDVRAAQRGAAAACAARSRGGQQQLGGRGSLHRRPAPRSSPTTCTSGSGADGVYQRSCDLAPRRARST